MKNGILIFITTLFCVTTWIHGQKALTEEEKIVAQTILGEARGEGKEGMRWVAAVIAERAYGWGKTPKQVCLQRGQFSCWNKNDKNRPKLDNLLKTHPEKNYAIHLATSLKTIDRKKFKNVDHYHHRAVKPYWIKGKKPLAKIGKHYFYKLRP